jgi:LPXTG-motif cell wall-anchored protein
MTGTTKVLGATTTTVVVGAMLPNTGSNSIVTLAIALAAGLITWGTLYAFNNK